MGALKRLLAGVGFLLLLASPARAGEEARWRAMIEEASASFGVPAAWIERVMAIESRGQTMLNGRPITSPAGAMGLMQLMPRTWSAIRERLRLGSDPHDPRDNIMAGTFYLRLMYDRFGYPGLFGAYNAGPGRYAAFLAGGQSLPLETRSYMAAASASVAGRTGAVRSAEMPIAGSSLFFSGRADAGIDGSPDRASLLFVRSSWGTGWKRQ